jgi:hypothetical protein
MIAYSSRSVWRLQRLAAKVVLSHTQLAAAATLAVLQAASTNEL